VHLELYVRDSIFLFSGRYEGRMRYTPSSPFSEERWNLPLSGRLLETLPPINEFNQKYQYFPTQTSLRVRSVLSKVQASLNPSRSSETRQHPFAFCLRWRMKEFLAPEHRKCCGTLSILSLFKQIEVLLQPFCLSLQLWIPKLLMRLLWRPSKLLDIQPC
jgi:hypothetical protein